MVSVKFGNDTMSPLLYAAIRPRLAFSPQGYDAGPIGDSSIATISVIDLRQSKSSVTEISAHTKSITCLSTDGRQVIVGDTAG